MVCEVALGWYTNDTIIFPLSTLPFISGQPVVPKSIVLMINWPTSGTVPNSGTLVTVAHWERNAWETNAFLPEKPSYSVAYSSTICEISLFMMLILAFAEASSSVKEATPEFSSLLQLIVMIDNSQPANTNFVFIIF